MAWVNWNTAMAIMAEQIAAEFASLGVKENRKSTKKLADGLSMPTGWSEAGHFGPVDKKVVAAARKQLRKKAK